jgi:DNA-directed RNA polymerase subunit RPC12/RpoP
MVFFYKNGDFMALIALKCPQCGGEIQLDNVKEIGFCMYCGSKVVLQEALSHQVRIDDSHKIDAWITLAYDALRSKNYVDSEQYANKIIESDLKNPDAWYIKGCCAVQEKIAIDNWKTALSYSQKDTPLWININEALKNPKNHFQTRIKTVTFMRGKAIQAMGRRFHISLNDEEKIALGNGEAQSIKIEEGSYILKGQIAGFKVIVPLDVKKDMTVYINLNKRDNKWEVISS